MSQKLMSKHRTQIIEDFIRIEGFVSAIICKHHLGHIANEFMREVLFNEYCNTGFKASILEKALTHYPEIVAESIANCDDSSMKNQIDIANKFRQMARIRNYFAHCNTTFSGNPIEGTPDDIPDPKSSNKNLDVENVLKTFSSLNKTMSNILVSIMDKLGILFMTNTDNDDCIIVFENPSKKQAI